MFIHGLGASKDNWAAQAERLSDRFRVLRYDLRSHGGSDAVHAPCTRSDLAADLISLLDALEIESAAVVGHSAGGVIAMHAVVEHPERVTALGLIGTASECNENTATWYRQTATRARVEGVEGALQAMGVRPGSTPVPDALGFAYLPEAMATLNDDPLTARMHEVVRPTIIIVGDKDFLGAGGSVILSRAIRGSEIEIVPGRGHGIYLEDPDWFAERLGEFFSRVLPSA